MQMSLTDTQQMQLHFLWLIFWNMCHFFLVLKTSLCVNLWHVFWRNADRLIKLSSSHFVILLMFLKCLVYTQEVKLTVNKAFIGEISNLSIMGLMSRFKFGVLREGTLDYVDPQRLGYSGESFEQSRYLHLLTH